jgi:hypothetical protein
VRTALAPAYELREEVGTPTDVGAPPFADVFPDDEPPTPWIGEFALKPAANEDWIPSDPMRVVPPSHAKVAVARGAERQSVDVAVSENGQSVERELSSDDRDLMPKFFALGGHSIEGAPSLTDEHSPSQHPDAYRPSLTPPLPLVTPISSSHLTAADMHAIQRMSQFPPSAAKRVVEMVVLGSVIAVAAFAIIASVVAVMRTM